jgi:sulfatase maturation enzyme AslB (radical SAM superfamily)
MLNDHRPDACAKCWSLEDAGIISDRQLKNSAVDLYFDKNLSTLVENCRQGNYSTVHYKIDTSNTCNATCVTCNGSASSSWAALEKKNKQPSRKTWSIQPVTADIWINYKAAISVSFRGGEPLLSKTNFYILEQLLEHNNSDCFVSFITNGSVELSDYQKHLLSKFKNMNFCFSIDGTGPIFEYMRYPLKWDQLLKNIEYCKNNNIMTSVSYTVSNLNVFYHAQTVKWFKDHNMNYLINLVYQPTHFQPRALPQELKVAIAEKNPDIADLLNQHSAQDQQNYQLFRAEIDKQDQWKNIRMSDFLPEFAHQLERFPI